MSQEADERAESAHVEWQEDSAIREAVAAERERCAALLQEVIDTLMEEHWTTPRGQARACIALANVRCKILEWE